MRTVTVLCVVTPRSTKVVLTCVLLQVSVTGVLWLSGLYLSSVSSCMGSLFGPPRILQSIANENVIPIIRILGHGVSELCLLQAVARQTISGNNRQR